MPITCLSYYLKKLSHPAVFTSNVLCVRLADGRLLKCVVTEVVSFSLVAFKTAADLEGGRAVWDEFCERENNNRK